MPETKLEGAANVFLFLNFQVASLHSRWNNAIDEVLNITALLPYHGHNLRSRLARRFKAVYSGWDFGLLMLINGN